MPWPRAPTAPRRTLGGLLLAAARPAPGALPAHPGAPFRRTPVKLTILAEDRVRYEVATGPLTVEAPTPETDYSPYHMLGSAIATCTFSTIASWAERAKLEIADLVIEVGWRFVEQPHRVGAFTVELSWPSLPPARLAAAQRAAALCTVSLTFEHPPAIAISVRGAGGSAPAASPAPAPSAAGGAG